MNESELEISLRDKVTMKMGDTYKHGYNGVNDTMLSPSFTATARSPSGVECAAGIPAGAAPNHLAIFSTFRLRTEA